MLNIKVEGNIYPGKRGFKIDGDAVLYKGHPKSNQPKTYKRIGVIGLGTLYNNSHAVIFVSRDKKYHYKIYRDGSIYPYYGAIEFKNMVELQRKNV